ncbi:hypothetical protein AB5J72_10240 [Streptomyces sp. CG1]
MLFSLDKQRGYLIGPGSVVNGTPYVIAHDAPIRELPAWLRDRIAPETS